MIKFMDSDFLLDTETGRGLYHGIAEKLPIIDYHCHLSPREIAEDRHYSNITEVWLYGDHYKWRAMRSCGVDEKYITGNASDYEKFREYCRIMPLLIGNPLYHWSHLELRRYFDCDLIINSSNCDNIWKITSKKLSEDGMSARNLIEKSGVLLLCTTDDPTDTLEYHKKIKSDGYGVRVLPAFRPDKILNIDKRGICDYLNRLGESAGCKITDYGMLVTALERSLAKFEAMGCRTADHGFDDYIRFERPNTYHADEIFRHAIEKDGMGLDASEVALWKAQMLRFLGKYYTEHNWVMQIHYGVMRNPNREMFASLGPDSGYDMIYGKPCVSEIALLFDYLMSQNALPRTVIYPINPEDNAAVATLCSSFSKGDGSGIPTVVQGCAWWFNDNIDGILEQLSGFAARCVLACHPGMLTDSRSFLSYPRHEYFRRIFCAYLGRLVESRQYPFDTDALSDIIRRVCFDNANRLFGFNL